MGYTQTKCQTICEELLEVNKQNAIFSNNRKNQSIKP